MTWLLMLLCAFPGMAQADVCIEPEDMLEVAETIDWTDYRIESHSYPYENLVNFWPILETVAANTGQPVEIVASVVAWETGARLKKGRSLRGGRGNRFWGPGQVGCGGGGNTYSWLSMLRKWMNAPRLQCRDLLDPYVGTTAAMLVLSHIQDEMAFKELHQQAKAHKDSGLFRLLHSKDGVFWSFRKPGGLDAETSKHFQEALISYDVRIPLEAALVVYSGGNLSYCQRREWRCRYVMAVMKWVEVSRGFFLYGGTGLNRQPAYLKERVL